jgi:hypothetical protein
MPAPARAKEALIEALPLEDRIHRGAYELYTQRGSQSGSELDDWLRRRRDSSGRKGRPCRPIVRRVFSSERPARLLISELPETFQGPFIGRSVAPENRKVAVIGAYFERNSPPGRTIGPTLPQPRSPVLQVETALAAHPPSRWS